MTATHWTVNTIKDAARARGSHWFDPDTMQTFGTKVLPDTYQGPGGVYFITEDDQYNRDLPKRFTLRRFLPESAGIETSGELCAHETFYDARQAAWDAASGPEQGGVSQSTEDFRPVSVLQQFLDDLNKHGSGAATPTRAADLLKQAARHHRFMERLCSDEAFCRGVNEEGEHPLVLACRERIGDLAKLCGAAGVLFSGDPRGCTVKLTFQDGFTNDFAKEGYCVPTEE